MTERIFAPGIDTEAQVLAIRAKAMEFALAGTVMVSWEGEGTSVGKQFSVPVEKVLSDSIWFLKSVNPNKYGWLSNRTRVIFA